MLKEKITQRKKTIGMHINLNDIAISRIAGLSGYDFVWLDLEHSYMSLEALMGHILALRSAGTAVIVRVPENDLTYTKKVLEMGVDGIIFPMVKSAEQAEELISYTLYPPYGKRGFGPMNAVGFGHYSVKEYVNNTKDNLCRFIQLEHKEAIDGLESIMENEFIDGYIFGPNDLSGSINELGRVFDENTTVLISQAISKLKKAGKYIGLSTGDTSYEILSHWAEMGIDMLSAGADFGFLQTAAQNNRATLERVMGSDGLISNKKFFGKGDLTPNTECSLLPPQILGAEAAQNPYYSDRYRKWQSAPCICKAGKTMLCCFSGDNYGGDEQPNNYNIILISKDGGSSWQPLYVIDHMDSVRLHEPVLWVDEKGTVWHFWAQSYNWWDGRGGVWAMRINIAENEITHTPPKRLCSGVLATTPIVLNDGRMLLPVSIWKRWKNRIHDYPEWGNAAVYISDGSREKFTYVGGASDVNSTFDENAVVQRADGSLYMIIRCDKYISFSESFDLGKTWTEPKKLMDHTSSRSYMAKLPSGNYLLVTNNDPKKRVRMTAFISTDECATWKPSLLLDEGIGSYPAGCVEEDGRVYVAYDYRRYNEEEIYSASFTEAELAEGKISEAGSYLRRLVVKGLDGRGKPGTPEYKAGP